MPKKFAVEFVEFLKEYKVMSLAIAFVMGAASTTLVNSFVKDIFMPLISPLLSGDEWRDAVLHLGPITLAYGSVLAELVNFVILAAIVFVVVKKVMRMGEGK